MAYLQLLRLPTLFTALADILSGSAVGQLVVAPGHPVSPWTLGWLLGASAALYLGGMVFNDVCDAPLDAIERPERPIPRGAVSLTAARVIAISLFALGLLSAWTAGPLSGAVALVLLAVICAYDFVLKKTLLGPVAMGLCRMLNFLFGATGALMVSGTFFSDAEGLFAAPLICVATSLGIYIAGVTWFARTEAAVSKRGPLIGASVLINFSLLSLLAIFLQPQWAARQEVLLIMLFVIGFTLNRRLWQGVANPAPATVQGTIPILLLSYVMVGATLVWWASGDARWASCTAALVIPAIVLGRVIRMS